MPITVDQFTDTTLTGDGVFDVMMRSVDAHLQQEYSKSRIRGTEYSTVYLGSLQTTMERALQLLLSKDKTDLENQLITAQIAKVNAEKLKVDAEILLLQQQEKNAIQEELVLKAQKCKLDAEFDLLVCQKGKCDAETALLNQKTVTEAAQTGAAGVEADSMVGRQKELYRTQAEGFTRDAEQRVAKIMVDTWNVRRTTDEGTIADATNKLDDASIGRAIDKLLTGINA